MRWVIVFLAGIIVGYGVFQIQGENSDHDVIHRPAKKDVRVVEVKNPQGKLPKKLSEQSRSSDVFPVDAIVQVEFFDKYGQTTITSQGVFVGPENYLVLPVSVLKHANTGKIFDKAGNQYTLGKVISASSNTGLVAFKSGDASRNSLRVSSNQSLYLGREFLSISLGGQDAGSIYSQPFEQAMGALVYTAHMYKSLDLTGSPLLDSETGYLIGIVIENGSDTGEYNVVDSTAVIDLLNSIFIEKSLSIAEFSRKFFEESPAGRLAKISSYTRDRKWEKAIELSEQLLEEDASYFNQLKVNLESSYVAHVKYLIGQNRLDNARNWLRRADNILGESAQRFVQLSEVQHKTGNLKEARDTLRRVIELNPESYNSILPMIRKNVNIELREYNQIGSDSMMIALLNEEIEYDDYSAYYYILGKTYFRISKYKEAVEKLSRAIYLDNNYEDELLPIINLAQEKLNLPDLIEVPFTAADRTIYVEVYLNNSVVPFNFVLDTGASYTSISKKVADQLGLSVFGNAITLNTANGKITAPVINLESINLNGATVYNVLTVVLNNMGDVDGLLGLNFLKHFNIDMDQTNGKIGLSRK